MDAVLITVDLIACERRAALAGAGTRRGAACELRGSRHLLPLVSSAPALSTHL